jgi:hypothetical protein
MKKLLYIALVAALAASFGCAITDYPIITDDRGDYSGIIRTAHKAYVVGTSQTATIWNDGTDELFSMVYQNQYGDQKLYTFNNFDPTGAVTFLDQTYCDWQFEGCEITRAWNPIQNDDEFDYELFEDCSGARSLSLLISQGSRLGECGDAMFSADKQSLAATFANLDTTTWRGETAYVLPVSAANTSITLSSATSASTMPVFGSYTGLVNDKLQLAFPMTPNARHQVNALRGWVAENGSNVLASIQYEGMNAELELNLRTAGLSHNAGRF